MRNSSVDPGPALRLFNQSKRLIASCFHKFWPSKGLFIAQASINWGKCKKMLLKYKIAANICFVEGPALLEPFMDDRT